MTPPTSNYEELLDQVERLTQETILLQEQLSSDLLGVGDSADVNHNLALIQKNYERGIELADNALKQCEQAKLLDSGQATCASEANSSSLPSSRFEAYSLKIPPGDPYSRLTVWRNKNRHLFSQETPEQPGQAGPREPWERRRPVSLHGPRDEVLFGAGGFGLACAAGARLQSPAPSLSDSCLGPRRPSSCSLLQDPPGAAALYQQQQHQQQQSLPRSEKNYGLSGNNTKEDSQTESTLQLQGLARPNTGWPMKCDLWSSSLSAGQAAAIPGLNNDSACAMNMSIAGGDMNSQPAAGMQQQGQRRLGAKMDVVYSLLSMLGQSTEGREDMSATLLSMSNSVESCMIMRQSGCLPLLVQLIHAPGQDPETRERASRALYNIVHARSDQPSSQQQQQQQQQEKSTRREIRVLRLLEQIRDYCQALRGLLEGQQSRQIVDDDTEKHPGATIAALMKLSFDEAHRLAMCQLGGLHAVAELVEVDHAAHGCGSDDPNCLTLRRYGGMALTNLTFGDSKNKALLCSFRQFMRALVTQLASSSDDLRQVTASVLRNLSWRADSSSKQTLREVGAVVGLMRAAMEGRKESTLKSILSALWNLSAHCSTNKIDICAVQGALAFLVDMLSYNAPSKTLAIVENAGGILRNVSSHIAVRDDYRAIVRERGCLQVLLRQLRSPSLTVVSNACGTLWNLSARCSQDQKLLWDLGAVPMLRSLINSKHKMISMGSSAALKNLLSARPNGSNLVHLDSTARGLGLPALPSLAARRQKALEQEIDQNLAETCDNIEPSTSPVSKDDKFSFNLEQTFIDVPIRTVGTQQQSLHATGQAPPQGVQLLTFGRSSSRESMRSVTSTHSDTIFEKVNRQARNSDAADSQIKEQSTSIHSATNLDASNSANSKGLSEKKYTLRYMNAIPERLKPGDPLPDWRCLKYSPSTISWASAPNQDVTSSKGSLQLSVEDNLSSVTPSDSPKAEIRPELSFCKPVASKAKPSCDKIMSPAEYTSDEDKQSSAYFTYSERNTSRTRSTDGTSLPDSISSSRASSALDVNSTEDGRLMTFTRNVPNKHSTFNSKIGRNVEENVRKIDSRVDSSKSTTNSENTLTVEVDQVALESDSAVFEDFQLESSSATPSLTLLDSRSTGTYNTCAQYEADTESSFPGSLESAENARFEQPIKDYHRDPIPTEVNLVRYKTNSSLNNIENEDVVNCKVAVNRTALSSSSVNQLDNQQDEDDISEITYTNDYYTVQETYTIGRDNNEVNQPSSPNDDCSLSIQCSTTLSYMSMDDRNSCFNDLKNENETANNTMHTALTSNSGSCESFNTIERSEHALLELCINSGDVKSSDASNYCINKNSTYGTNTITSPKKVYLKSGDVIAEKSKEEYRRQRDPDAMIASLDRLTATLVQQTEAMRERESSAMRTSLLSSDTWNEDSPNDFSFPSISMSAPLVASFKSDLQDDSSCVADTIPASMTESRIIEIEANKLAEAVGAEANQLSLISLDLDAINPPSTMGSLVSLTASGSGAIVESTDSSAADKSRYNSTSSLPVGQLGMRKKSLPVGVVARRALSQGQNRSSSSSLENLLNECNNGNNSQLENVKPPSIMDELLLDAADMENSMLSVASITSEIADVKDNDSLTGSDPVFDLIKPVANVLSIACMRRAQAMEGSATNSLSECLENINPPSLLHEVSRLEDLTMDANTQCSDTLCIDIDLESEDATRCAFDERIEADDTDATPISSECPSSVESTPKKRLYRNYAGLTPKQKRHLAKERYKTYTIEAERIKKEQQEAACKIQQENENISKTGIAKAFPSSKLKTPKQRRQEDRARFQTQVLNSPTIEQQQPSDDSSARNESPSRIATSDSAKAGIQMKTGIPMFRTGIPKFGSVGGNRMLKKSASEEKPSVGYRIDDKVALPIATNEATNAEQSGGKASQNVENLQNIRGNSSRPQNTQMRIPSTISRKSDFVSSKALSQPSETTVPLLDEDTDDSDDSRGGSNSDSDERAAKRSRAKGPRIVKPGTSLPEQRAAEPNQDQAEAEQQEAPKAIRGRRKPLYSSPAIGAGRKAQTPQASPLKHAAIPISRSNTSPIVSRATANRPTATALRQVANFQRPSTTPKAIASFDSTKRSSIPQKGSSTAQQFSKAMKRLSTPVSASEKAEMPSKPLERQGTFTKEEPEMPNTPTVAAPASPFNSKLAKPATALTNPAGRIASPQVKSKISVRAAAVGQRANPTKSLAEAASVERTAGPTTGIPMMTKRSSTNLNGSLAKSSSNYQIAPTTNGESTAPRKLSLGQRSNSNSSIVSNSSNQGSHNKMVKEATSRIASLWKKVEENKNKQHLSKAPPDSRRWITPNRRDSADSTNFPCFGDQRMLFRSSTFEGVDSAGSR